MEEADRFSETFTVPHRPGAATFWLPFHQASVEEWDIKLPDSLDLGRITVMNFSTKTQ
jgi:hypothetical protein